MHFNFNVVANNKVQLPTHFENMGVIMEFNLKPLAQVNESLTPVGLLPAAVYTHPLILLVYYTTVEYSEAFGMYIL